MDELGSGIRNTYKYCKIYSGTAPIFTEGDVFRTIIPLSMVAGDQAPPQAPPAAESEEEQQRIRKILEFCITPKSRQEIQAFIEIKDAKHFRLRILNPLIKGGLLKLTIPDKPTSPNQRYFS
ncbi:Fic family protein [Acetobacterium sp. MES1]|nr:hypothetical protein [Acetobacterium sp. MES1]